MLLLVLSYLVSANEISIVSIPTSVEIPTCSGFIAWMLCSHDGINVVPHLAPSNPVRAEGVVVGYSPVNDDIGAPLSNRLQFLFSRIIELVVCVHAVNSGIPRLSGEYESAESYYARGVEREVWGGIFVKYLKPSLRLNFQDGTLSRVVEPKRHIPIEHLAGKVVVATLCEPPSSGPRELRSNPCPFVGYKVLSQVLPLKVSNYRVSNGEWDRQNLNEGLHPLKGLIPGLLGLFGIAWGWLNLRFERRLPLSGIVFLIGCLLWGCACFSLLPWLASYRFP